MKFYFKKTGRFHAWDHILLVKKSALRLMYEFSDVDENIVLASVYLHDIGRSVKDEGHPEISVKIATPFLKKLGLTREDLFKISDAVSSHDKDKINSAKTNEAKILFDADKLQILTVFGFFRVCFWLMDERKMKMEDAVNFLWNYVLEVRRSYLQTKLARKLVDEELPTLKSAVNFFNNWIEP